jgi:hypothetical protein
MSSNPPPVNINASYYPNEKQLSFDPAPPFTSDQALTNFVFTLKMGTDSNGATIPGTVTWANPAFFFGTPAPSPLWTVTVEGQVLTIEDTNSNTFSPTPLKFPFTLLVSYNNGEPQSIDPTILNAQIPPTGGGTFPPATSVGQSQHA